MRFTRKKWRWVGILLGLALVAFVVVRTWVVPAILLRQIRAEYRGKVEIGNWWFGLRSAGVTEVKLHETEAGDSPVWLSADRVSTDLSISRMLRGRLTPSRVEIDRPKVAFRLDEKGQPLTRIPLKPDLGGGQGVDPTRRLDLPEILAKGGIVTFDQVGRQPMTIHGVEGRLAPQPDGGKLDVTTDDPAWGRVAVNGHFDPTFKNGRFEINTPPGFVADPERLKSIPFIPKEVWANLEPRGPVDAKVKLEMAIDTPKPVQVHTDLYLKGTAAKLNSLQIESHETTGHVAIDDGLVTIDELRGKSIDGSISARGTLDFGQKVPRFDLDLRLKEVDVTKTPPSWQLGDVGATGRLSGRVNLKVALKPDGPDLGGTAGRAVIENGSFQGIPIKSLSLGLKADGNDIQYETMPQGSVDKDHLDAPLPVVAQADPNSEKPAKTAEGKPSTKGAILGSAARDEILGSAASTLPVLMMASNNKGVLSWIAYGISEVVAYQVRQAADHHQGEGGFRLPKTISTQIELADVDLATILEKVKKFGIVIPVPIAGKFSIKATATIPLGTFRDLRGYVFVGDASLKEASIDHVDLGLVATHVEFANGVLKLIDFRGHFVDKPSGDAKTPPPPTSLPPMVGPLPAGGFRANLHAEIAPKGLITTLIEGDHLPLGEIFAPVFPVPTPLSGELTTKVEVKGDLARLDDPKAWTLDGHADSRRIKYRSAILDRIATEVHIKDGRVDLKDLSASLKGHPLEVTGGLDLSPPFTYSAKLSVESWQLAEVLGFVPGLPTPAPASGVVDARGEVSGTLRPFAVETRGGARILSAKALTSDLGNVVFKWATEGDVIALTGIEVFAFGGKTSGEARIPTKPGKLLEASATWKGIDSGTLSAAFLGPGLTLVGRADGKLKVTMPLDASVIDADATLTAPNLMVREGAKGEMPVKSLQVTAKARNGLLTYDATADSLGGKVLFHGNSPIAGDLSKAIAAAELRAVNFRLSEVWKGLGMVGGVAHLDGFGALDANLRARLRPFQVYSRGIFELRSLQYGRMVALGNLSGIAAISPDSWKVEQVTGELLGGSAQGEANSETRTDGSKVVAFDFKVERASLARLAMQVPRLARQIEGYGTLRVAGRIAEALQANTDLTVPKARVFGVDLTDLRVPVVIDLNPTTGAGSAHTRHWTARAAGGSIRGSASMRIGGDRSFQTETQLINVDLHEFGRLQGTNKKVATGKVSGKVALNGPNPDHLEKLRGRVEVKLDDASLVELPVFKQLDRFLGASRGGGLFEDGDMTGNIANRALSIEQLTLRGRLIQLHAQGTVTFAGNLNLEILVNSNDVIPQTGATLVNAIPGLGQALGRSEEALLKIASFLENRLLKFRVTGTMTNPTVQLDPGVTVGDNAAGFFASALKVPIRSGR